MKKINIVVSAIVMMLSFTVLVFAETPADKEFDDTLYRGEKWGFEFGVPENETLVILSQDREETEIYDNGYVGRIENKTFKYNIILLKD